MSLVIIIMDSDDNKINIDWFYLKKIVIDIVRGDQFLYISLEFDYKHSSCCYSIFFSILQSPFLKAFFLFYIIFLLYLHPSRVD